MSEPKAPIALMSRTWSCASLSEGLNVILQDAAQNAGLSDELDSTLLANLEEKGCNLLYRQYKSRPGIANYQGSLKVSLQIYIITQEMERMLLADPDAFLDTCLHCVHPQTCRPLLARDTCEFASGHLPRYCAKSRDILGYHSGPYSCVQHSAYNTSPPL